MNLAKPTLLALACAISCSVHAQDADPQSKLKISGFARITAGKIISGGSGMDDSYAGPTTINGVDCPCYTADWSNGGVYGQGMSLNPESHIGLQANYALSPQTSLVGQAVLRGATGDAEISWAYASHRFNSNWELSVGRKRIPLYYYSDFQDIGVSYPWVATPPELYGWDATNYNGASLRYTHSVSGWNVASSLFAGNETVDKSPYYKLYYTSPTTVKWNNIIGADLEMSKGPLTLRGIYTQADTSAANSTEGFDTQAGLVAYGIAANLDYDSWFVLTEATQLTRSFTGANPYSYKAPAFTVGVGLRVGKWTPFVNYSEYNETSSDLSLYSPQSYRRAAVTLRYDFDGNSAIKAQWDRNIDATQNFGGNASIFRISYDKTF